MSKLPFWSLWFGHFCHFSPKPGILSFHICLIKSCNFVIFRRCKMIISFL
ncbi:hypothetical protein Hanom_Chr16g01447141 [Helianthus anomalus]